jgi:hypothetical protein
LALAANEGFVDLNMTIQRATANKTNDCAKG